MRAVLIWCGLAVAIAVPLAIAAASPLLQWREPVYIAAGFAGAAALAVMLVQPLLASRFLPGLNPRSSRTWHRSIGIGLVGLIVVHVGGLWITSPPDVIDALTFTSPTPFSLWGVIAMWALFAAAVLAAFRSRLKPAWWRMGHKGLVTLAAATTVAHAMLIDGTMGLWSKIALCGLVLLATAYALRRSA